jgi:predicted DNA-binding transcriptional regulator YafY
LDRASDAALIKLLAALPSMSRRGAEAARQRIYVDTGGWRQPDEAFPFLAALQEAIGQERKVRLTYQRGHDSSVERLADPLGLVAKGSVWYLVAAVEGDMRTYRVSRVQDVQLTDEPCVRPPGFDLAAYWAQSTAEFKAALPRYPAAVRVAPDILPRVRQGGHYTRIEREHPPGAAGWVRLDMNFEEEHNACEYVLSFGPQIEVLEPLSLREKVANQAAGILALYAQSAYAALDRDDTHAT